MGYIHSVQLNDNSTHLIEPILFTTAGGTSTALIAAISNFELAAGVYVNLKVGTVGANATLNVNNTGAKDIYYNDVQISAGMLTEGNVYTFVYDGAHWVILGDITGKNIMIGTTAEWNNHLSYIAPRGTICIYTDRGSYINNGTTIIVPGIKISDGISYVSGLPFVGDDHINDNIKHITSEERTFWNNKLNTDIDGEILVFNRS